MPRALLCSWGGGLFLMSEAPLYMAGVLVVTKVSLNGPSIRVTSLQGYLAHKKTQPPRTLP